VWLVFARARQQEEQRGSPFSLLCRSCRQIFVFVKKNKDIFLCLAKAGGSTFFKKKSK
jgi:hypothetical protein